MGGGGGSYYNPYSPPSLWIWGPDNKKTFSNKKSKKFSSESLIKFSVFFSSKGCWRRSARLGCHRFRLCRLAVSARPSFDRSLHQKKEIDARIGIGTADHNPSVEIGSRRVRLDHQSRPAASPLSHSPGKLDKCLKP